MKICSDCAKFTAAWSVRHAENGDGPTEVDPPWPELFGSVRERVGQAAGRLLLLRGRRLATAERVGQAARSAAGLLGRRLLRGRSGLLGSSGLRGAVSSGLCGSFFLRSSGFCLLGGGVLGSSLLRGGSVVRSGLLGSGSVGLRGVVGLRRVVRLGGRIGCLRRAVRCSGGVARLGGGAGRVSP